jgi:hypothetical protein
MNFFQLIMNYFFLYIVISTVSGEIPLGVASRYVGTKSKAPALHKKRRNERNKIHYLQAGFTSEDACF